MVMYESRMIPDTQGRLCAINANPAGLPEKGMLAQSAVNVLTIARNIKWEEAYRLLLEQAHGLCLMPDDEHCVKAMLRAQGYYLQPTLREYPSVEEVCRYAEEHCFDGQQILLRMDTERGKYGRMLAVLPSAHPALTGQAGSEVRYRCAGNVSRLGQQARQIWVRWSDGQDHSPKARRKGRTGGGRKTYTDDRAGGAYAFYQANPDGNAIGDCAVRAMAAACGVDWHQALELLAAATNYHCTTVNERNNIEKALLREGFLRCPSVRADGHHLDGAAFCAEMDRRYHSGERIFAYVGASHVAAVLPMEGENGTHYRIVDNWDSTSRKIFTYYVKFPPRTREPAPEPVREKVPSKLEEAALTPGFALRHPVYGPGTVTGRIPGGLLRAQFKAVGEKVLSAKWVVENCLAAS